MSDAVYKIITDRIVAALEAGTVPWHKPWNSAAGMPRNAVSKKEYRGINVFMLTAARFDSPWWASYRQITEHLGGQVRRGEKSTPVIFWKVTPRKDEGDEPDPETGKKQSKYWFMLRYYSAFNLEQADLPEKVQEKFKVEGAVVEHEPISECERIVAGMPNPPRIEWRGHQACYSSRLDRIAMPPRKTFNSPEEIYSTLFHELTHSTGHSKRLARETMVNLQPFGTCDYSKEELVAEMGAAFLCGVAGIENTTVDNSAAYIASWLKKLRDDKKMVILAGAQAQRAADYVLGRQFVEQEREAEAA